MVFDYINSGSEINLTINLIRYYMLTQCLSTVLRKLIKVLNRNISIKYLIEILKVNKGCKVFTSLGRKGLYP